MARAKKRVEEEIWVSDDRKSKVVYGQLVPLPGHRPIVENLFLYVGEKLPFECLPAVRNHIAKKSTDLDGVYMAHDSFGVPRYGGRGRVFSRLRSRKRRYPKELVYFSFYIVKNKGHERELENAILRAAGPQMIINKVKVRANAEPGSVKDYEPGTRFYQRKDSRSEQRRRNPSN
jgi:hypothetical protein